MKKSILFVLFSILAFSFSVSAQDDLQRYSSPRLENYVNQLKGFSVDLVDRTSEDLRRGNNNTRADIEAAFLAQQLDASVGFFQEMLRDNRRVSELRDGAAILSDLARRAPNYGTNNILWRDARNTINDISRELGGNSGGGGRGNNNEPRSGSATWRGTVDNTIQLFIQDRNIETRVISGTPYDNATFNFTSGLPARSVTVEALKRTGRGTVRVIQQPNRGNDFTAIVEIFDDGSGAREYQLEISWR